MDERERLAEIKARSVYLAGSDLDWLVSEVENTDNRIENYLAKLDNQRAENARLNQQVENLKAEVRRRQGWAPSKEAERLRELLGRLEWAGRDRWADGADDAVREREVCPACGGERSSHAPGCWLVKELGR
jgi:DNA repair exonuclease SbcCD ATPase subunit